MLKLKVALSKNPLLAGAVAVGVGVALVALGSRISGAANGQNAGFTGGTIDGLGIGGRGNQEAQIYRFPDRNVASGGRTAVERNDFVFSPIIIGQNDPVAQRQIADMVDNARRRGVGRRY